MRCTGVNPFCTQIRQNTFKQRNLVIGEGTIFLIQTVTDTEVGENTADIQILQTVQRFDILDMICMILCNNTDSGHTGIHLGMCFDNNILLFSICVQLFCILL